MKTIADFKLKMIKGAKVDSKLFWKKNGEWQQVNDLKDREVTIVQSNSFALSINKDGKIVNGWCDWPKSNQFTVIDENTAQIENNNIRLIYKFQT